jgi:hypothetical protein
MQPNAHLAGAVRALGVSAVRTGKGTSLRLVDALLEQPDAPGNEEPRTLCAPVSGRTPDDELYVLRSQKKGWHRVVRPLDALKGDDWDVVPSSQAGEQYLQLPLHPHLRSCSPARTLPGVPSDESGPGYPPRCCSRGIRLRIRHRYRLLHQRPFSPSLSVCLSSTGCHVTSFGLDLNVNDLDPLTHYEFTEAPCSCRRSPRRRPSWTIFTTPSRSRSSLCRGRHSPPTDPLPHQRLQSGLSTGHVHCATLSLNASTDLSIDVCIRHGW